MSGINPAIIRIRHILLHSWDPIGISNYEGASDEYDIYGDRIFEMIHSGAGADDVKNYLYAIAKNDIGLDYPGLVEKSESAAREIMEFGWKSH